MTIPGWLPEIWRDFNVALGLIAIYLTARRHAEYHGHWTEQERAFSRAVMMLMLAVLIASAFGAYANFPLTIGVPLVTVGFVCVVSATVRRPDRFRDLPPDHLFVRVRDRLRRKRTTV